jgi:hypothetical protein
MHHHGGAYSESLPASGSWKLQFESFHDNDVWAIGFNATFNNSSAIACGEDYVSCVVAPIQLATSCHL